MRPARSPQIGVLALAFAVSLVAGLVISPETSAQGCVCIGMVHSGPVVQGSGATCTAAYDNARNAALIQAAGHCVDLGGTGACPVDFIITSACSFSGGQWHLDGYATYRCRFCF